MQFCQSLEALLTQGWQRRSMESLNSQRLSPKRAWFDWTDIAVCTARHGQMDTLNTVALLLMLVSSSSKSCYISYGWIVLKESLDLKIEILVGLLDLFKKAVRE
jgi:hypothetical protein